MAGARGPDSMDRFVRSVPAHLEVLQRAHAERSSDPEGSRATIRRIAAFIAEEARDCDLGQIEGASRAVTTDESADYQTLPPLIDALEALVGGRMPVQVLIVEDEPTDALLTRQALAGMNAVTVVAETAAEARQWLATKTFDLIILDLILPDADGRNLLMSLGRDLATAGTSVIVSTARGTPATRAECLAYGASAFLEKPIDPEKMRAAAAGLATIGAGRLAAVERVSSLPDRAEVREAFLRLQMAQGESPVPIALALIDTDLEGKGWDEEGRLPPEVLARHGKVAEALEATLSNTDVLGTWGVTQFIVLFTGRAPDACVRLLERVQERLDPDSGVGFHAGVTEVADDQLFEDAVSWASRLANEAGMGPTGSIRHTTLSAARAPLVMVIEDDPISASLVRNRLERSGFEIEHYDNGLEGLDAIRRVMPDLLILDIRLPGMDGFEILSRMKAEGLTKDIKTIVLTGLGRESDVARAFDLDADDYLVKPFSPVELTARALRLIRR